jgi:hypothetical protein
MAVISSSPMDRPRHSRCCSSPVAQLKQGRVARIMWTVAFLAVGVGALSLDAAAASQPHRVETVALVADSAPHGVLLRPTQSQIKSRLFGYRVKRPEVISSHQLWLVGRLDFRITLSRSCRTGSAYVMAGSRRKCWALIKFKTKRSSTGMTTHWSTDGLAGGPNGGVFTGRSTTIRFKNYLQTGSIGKTTGEGDFTVDVDRLGGARVQAVEILPTSGIQVTGLAPYPLEFETVSGPGVVVVGQRFSVSCRIRTIDQSVVSDVTPSAECDGGVGCLRARPGVMLVTAGPRRIVFDFQAPSTPTTANVILRTDSSRNGATAVIRIRVVEAPSSPPRFLLPVAGVVCLVASVGATRAILGWVADRHGANHGRPN